MGMKPENVKTVYIWNVLYKIIYCDKLTDPDKSNRKTGVPAKFDTKNKTLTVYDNGKTKNWRTVLRETIDGITEADLGVNDGLPTFGLPIKFTKPAGETA
jgi:hypothetical protein